MMEVTLLVASWLLALVFLVASMVKFADWVGTRLALMGLGVPAPMATQLKILLPLAELTGAATLTYSCTGATGPA